MQPSTERILGTQTVPLLDRIRLPAGTSLDSSAPADVTPSLVVKRYFPGCRVTSEIMIHGMGPPKYRGSPFGRGDAPRKTSATSPTVVQAQFFGRGGNRRLPFG